MQKIWLLAITLLTATSCIHGYSDRTLSLEFPAKDKSAVLKVIRSAGSVFEGTCVEKARADLARLDKKLDIFEMGAPVGEVEHFCFEAKSSSPTDYSGIGACIYDRDSSISRLEVIASGRTVKYPFRTSPRGVNLAKFRFKTLKESIEAKLIHVSNVKAEEYIKVERDCGDY